MLPRLGYRDRKGDINMLKTIIDMKQPHLIRTFLGGAVIVTLAYVAAVVVGVLV